MPFYRLGQSESAGIRVSGGGAPPASSFAFQVDWLTATGTSDNAVSDGSRFDKFDICTSTRADVMQIIDGSGLSLPASSGMTNVCQMTLHGTKCGNVEVTAAVAASTTHYGGFWFRDDRNTGNIAHAVVYPYGGTLELIVWGTYGYSDGAAFGLKTKAGYPNDIWFAGAPSGGHHHWPTATW